MCSIFGSFDVDEAKKLKLINVGRGALTHSSTVFDNDLNITNIRRADGDLVDFVDNVSGYHLYHQQAPTTQELNTVHPSEYCGSFLWHNGIIKQESLSRLAEKNGDASTWDTHQINILLCKRSVDALSELEGSFSCVWYYNNQLYMFRNAIAPMFMCGSTISSTQFHQSISTDPNTLYSLDVINDRWNIMKVFVNNETPFFFLD